VHDYVTTLNALPCIDFSQHFAIYFFTILSAPSHFPEEDIKLFIGM